MRRTWVGLLITVGLIVGCGPAGETANDTEEGETETGTGTSTGGATLPATMTNATTQSSNTAASMSADGADDDADDDGPTTGNPDPDSTGGTKASDEASDEPPCPPGELDCPCDIGSTCDEELECVDGTCVAPAGCEEPEGEPNDDEPSAVELDAITCGAEPIVTEGALDGLDMDWFTAGVTQGAVCFGQPSAEVASDAELSVCMFAQCTGGNTNVSCGFGAGGPTPETSPEGVDGCCSVGSVAIDDVNCFDVDQSFTIWVRVSAAEEACVPYELTVDF